VALGAVTFFFFGFFAFAAAPTVSHTPSSLFGSSLPLSLPADVIHSFFLFPGVTWRVARACEMAESEPYEFLFKLLMIGDSGVGKSSVLLRYTDDTYDEGISATIGVDFRLKRVTLPGGAQRANLTIWDTAGQEKFRSLTSSYYRGTHGVVVVYDVGSRESFTNVARWLGEVDAYSTNPDAVRMLVANKIDVERRVVSREEGAAFARDRGMLFFECSAKSRLGIQQAFEEMLAKIYETPSLRDDASQLKPRIGQLASGTVAPGDQAVPCGGWC
jgi:Ras-related protein Rab-18